MKSDEPQDNVWVAYLLNAYFMKICLTQPPCAKQNEKEPLQLNISTLTF